MRKFFRGMAAFLAVSGLLSNLAFAAFSRADAGTASAQFLKIGVSARAVAMGEAFGAVADDGTAIYYNVAGLSQLEKREASAMYERRFGLINYNYISYAHPLRNGIGTVAGAITLLTQNSIQKVSAAGSSTGLGTFSPYDLSIAGAFAHKWKVGENGAFHAGGALKGIISKIDTNSAGAVALDFGMLYRKQRGEKMGWGLGLAGQNLGTKMKFVTDSFKLPFNLRLGASADWKIRRGLDKWTVAVDGNFPVDFKPNIRFGTEYDWRINPNWHAALRLGFRTDTINDINAISGASFGAGFGFKGLGVDFGFRPFGSLGGGYRVSIGYKF